MALCEEKDPGWISNFATFGRRLPCWCALFSAEEIGLRFMLGSWLPAPRTCRRRRPAEGAKRAAELGAGEAVCRRWAEGASDGTQSTRRWRSPWRSSRRGSRPFPASGGGGSGTARGGRLDLCLRAEDKAVPGCFGQECPWGAPVRWMRLERWIRSLEASRATGSLPS
jgi:hypothetical protein